MLTLNLEDKILVILVAASAADEGAEVAVDGLDDAEGDLVAAVGEDAIEVGERREGELLERGQTLPAETAEAVAYEW